MDKKFCMKLVLPLFCGVAFVCSSTPNFASGKVLEQLRRQQQQQSSSQKNAPAPAPQGQGNIPPEEGKKEREEKVNEQEQKRQADLLLEHQAEQKRQADLLAQQRRAEARAHQDAISREQARARQQQQLAQQRADAQARAHQLQQQRIQEVQRCKIYVSRVLDKYSTFITRDLFIDYDEKCEKEAYGYQQNVTRWLASREGKTAKLADLQIQLPLARAEKKSAQASTKPLKQGDLSYEAEQKRLAKATRDKADIKAEIEQLKKALG